MTHNPDTTHDAHITVLGCGTSTGVPIPGCECRVCLSPNKKNQRLRTSALLSFPENHNLLIDAGPDLRQQALRYQVNEIDGVLYTHAHADHILGTDDLRVFNFRRKSPIPCYGSQHTLAELQSFFGYIFNPDPLYGGGALAKLTCNTITSGTPFSSSNKIRILPFTLYHGKLPVTGYRVGGLVYATDCNSIPDESLDIMMEAEVLFIDGLRTEPHATHFTIEAAIETAVRIKAKKTYLIHMTHSVDYEEYSAKLPTDIELAYDGLQVGFTI